jgi:hypothetical protein
MFLDLSGVASVLSALGQPEKCSWSYSETRPLLGSILSDNAPGKRYGVGVLFVLPVLQELRFGRATPVTARTSEDIAAPGH